MVMIYTFGSRQPPIIGSGTPFKTFDNVADAISHAEDRTEESKPTTFYLPADTYDFSGVEIPPGSTWVGEGLIWNNTFDTGGFGTCTTITGSPIQKAGSSANAFEGLVFDGGFTARRQWTHFINCGFTGSAGLVLDFESGTHAPFYNRIERCFFREISDTCLTMKGFANVNVVTSSVFSVESGQRGIVGESQTSVDPTTCLIEGCSIERKPGVTSLGSYLYGDWTNLVFRGNYFDPSKPTFTDGGDIALTSGARNCHIYLPNDFGDTYVHGGSLRNTFYSATDVWSIGGGVTDLGTFSGIPKQITLTAGSGATQTMPPVAKGYNKYFTITCLRGAGVTLDGSGAETINGSADLVISDGEGYRFFTNYNGGSPTDWIAKQLW